VKCFDLTVEESRSIPQRNIWDIGFYNAGYKKYMSTLELMTPGQSKVILFDSNSDLRDFQKAIDSFNSYHERKMIKAVSTRNELLNHLKSLPRNGHVLLVKRVF